MIDEPKPAVANAADSTRDSSWRDDRGSASLSVALLAPIFIVLMFAAVQAAMWGHARTEARVAASDAAAQVARFSASSGAAQASVQARLSSRPLTNVAVSITNTGDVVVVTVTADAPGIIIGTSRPISVTEAVPVERIVP
jgi:Flp pilus assembly protein TadG